MALTGIQKVAAFLLSLDTETASAILSEFSEDEIARVTTAMLEMRSLGHEVIQEVQKDFIESAMAGEEFIPDTRAVARELISSAMGEERAREMLDESGVARPRSKPFEALLGADATRLADALMSEHPQTVAQVLSHLDPQQAGVVLSKLPEELHSDVVLRMTRLETASAELLERLDKILLRRVQADTKGGAVTEESKNKLVAEMLNVVGKTVRKKTLEDIEKEDPERAREIESLMFVFEDFMRVDDKSIRKIVMEIDNDTLALALKTATEELKDKFLRNLSKRAAAMVTETLEELGPRPISDVEAAQREIVSTAGALDEQGEIVLRPTEEEQLV